jgi:Flp pilus assembly protein TadD
VRAGRYDLAIGEFQQALSIKENGDIYLRLGETYRRKGDLASAIGALERAKTFMPENAIVVNTLALVLDSAGKRHDARQAYEDALKLDPRNGVAMNNLAYLLAQEDGESDKALEYARRAQELLPDMPEVSDTLGWVHMKKGQTDEAIRIFREAIGKQPAHASFHYHLAMALSQKGDRAGALAEARTALENNPTPKEREEIGEFVRATQ